MKSEFYWGLFSSLIVALFMTIIRYLPFSNDLSGIDDEAYLIGLSFSLLPFVAIYFVVGVIMLFSKKSEKFAKGLLLSALILFVIMMAAGLIRP